MYTRINRVWRVRERESEKEGEEGRKRNVFGRGEKKFHRNGGSHCSLADGGARTWPGNGTWLVALSYLQQSSQQTPSSMLQRLASYLNGIALFLRRLFLLSLDREGEERGRKKQTYKTLDEFLIVVVQSLRVISRKGWQVRAYRIFQRELNFIGASTPNARIDQAL